MIARNELDAHIGTHSTYRDCQHDPVHEWSERGDCIAQRVAQQAKPRKRTKQVYGTGKIPHLWSHKTQESARNPQRNLFFEHGTIYSYGTHFPIAKHYQNSVRSVVLFTTDRHSVTTSGHCSAVAMAIPDSVPVFHVPFVQFGDASAADAHRRNLESYVDRINRAVTASARARSSYRKESEHEQASTLRTEAKDYARFSGFPVLLYLSSLPLTLLRCLRFARQRQRRRPCEQSKPNSGRQRKRRQRQNALTDGEQEKTSARSGMSLSCFAFARLAQMRTLRMRSHKWKRPGAPASLFLTPSKP